jgi:hypothetical protein
MSGVITFLATLSPAVWIGIGAAILSSLALSFLIPLVRDLLWPLKSNQLLMEKWNPTKGEMAPKCEWAVYLTPKCNGGKALAKDYWSVCGFGGEVYRDEECSRQSQRQFYQQWCGIGCRHMCLVSNFDCGSDGYTYLNGTQFAASPKHGLSTAVFSPDYAGKQMTLLDQRYVYQMTQCRDTCDRFSATRVNRNGYSGCRGFVLRAPDPIADPRPAYAHRTTCMLLGYADEVGHNAPLDEFLSDIPADAYPVTVSNVNQLFGYQVARQAVSLPPVVVGFKQ